MTVRPTDDEIRELAAQLEAISEHPKVRQSARIPAYSAAEVLRWVLGENHPDPDDTMHYVTSTRASARNLKIGQ